MCVKDDLIRRKSLLSTSTQTPNHVNTFSLDFAFLFAAWLQQIKCMLEDVNSLFADNILSLIAFIISYCLFVDELVYALNRATVVLIIISVDKTQLLLILGDVAVWLVYVIIRNLTLLAGFIPITKIRDLLLKTLENTAKSRILLACVDGRIRQCYLTICAILADYEEQVLLTSIKKNCYCTRCTKHYNFNIYVSLVTDILHLLLKGLVMKMLDFMQDMLDDIYPSSRKTWDNSTILVTAKGNYTIAYICMYGALDSICTRANSEAYYITIVKQFYSITNKKEVTCSLLFCRLGWLILGIQPYLTKLPLSEVAANIAISNFIYAVVVFVSCISVQIHLSIKCWRSSSKRHNDSEYCNEEVVRYLYLILIIIDYTCYDKDRKHIAYIRAFSEVLLFNNNGQIDNTTGMLSILQAFKFYDLSMIICLVHLVLRDLPDLTTRTTMSYYVNNYIN
ncbi:hypothetical protein HBI76_163390 [Parastagonospora nodorum]|nr:hypothetical protein HBI76_163390 [Parastagonospora nodorum]